MNINTSLITKTNFQYFYKKIIAFTISCSCSLLLVGTAIADGQETPSLETQAPSSSGLLNTNPANLQQNGVQFNNGFSNPLQPLSCNQNQRNCVFFAIRSSPYGTEGIVGASFGFGGSADDTKAEVEKAKVEIERIKGDRDYQMQLREKLASAIEEGKTVRINIFAIALAPLEGYKNHLEYLNVITNDVYGR